MRYRLLEVALLTVAATAVLPASVAGQQGGAAAAADTGWTVRASAAADLWYHGLAVVGFGAGGPFPLYNRDYAERVRAAKQEAGVYPTALDSVAAGLRLEFEEQRDAPRPRRGGPAGAERGAVLRCQDTVRHPPGRGCLP
jgi:hypothetical protein